MVVDPHPDGRYAVVLIADDEPPHVQPCTALCWLDDEGWRRGAGHGGWSAWYRTNEDASGEGLGFDVTGDDPPVVRWNVPQPRP